MKNYPKVLIAAPTSTEKDYCFNDWADMVNAIDYPNFEVLLVDNSASRGYRTAIESKGFKYSYLPRSEKEFPTSFVCRSMNEIRRQFLNADYDYLFILETDVFIKPDWLNEMVQADLPVHNISYFIDYEKGRSLCVQTLDHISKKMKVASPNMTNQIMTGEIKQFLDYELTTSTTLIGSGYGCTLIDKEVIKYIQFRIEPEQDKKIQKHTFPDTHFHLDLWKMGIGNYFNSKLIAEHRNGIWKH